MSGPLESTILRPRDPLQLNSDEWLEFELKNAFIYDPADPTGAPVSLLHAGTYRPLSISGRLEPPNARNSASWLDIRVSRAVPVELTGIKEFSYGEYGDGTVDIWAAGQAGWFTIRPSRHYKNEYNGMIQALKLLYFAADSYKALRKYGDLSAPDFFKKCSDQQIEGCKNVSEAAELFKKHRMFLIASMLANKENVQWYRVPLYMWYQENFSAEVAVIRHRVGQKPARGSKPASQKSTSQSPAPSTASSRRKKATAKQSSVTPKPPLVPTPNARSTRSTRSQSIMTADSNSTMDLTSVVEQEPQSTPKRIKELQPTASSDDEAPGTGGKGKGKSSLRPRPSKYVPSSQAGSSMRNSPAGAAQSKKAAAPRSEILEDLEEDAMQIDSLDEDIPDKPQLEDAASTTSDSDSNSDSNSDMPDTDITAAGAPPPPPSNPTTKPTLPLRPQDTESNNQGDTWHCPTDGCMHKTYAASEPHSQLLIAAHRQTHEFDDDERVRLVRRMEAPYLPVNRLMDRVRGIAAQKGFPAPIVQRY